MSTPPLAASGMAPGPFAGPQAQQAAREVNTASLCRIGQETVQDIVYRTMEIFQLLRNMQVGGGRARGAVPQRGGGAGVALPGPPASAGQRWADVAGRAAPCRFLKAVSAPGSPPCTGRFPERDSGRRRPRVLDCSGLSGRRPACTARYRGASRRCPLRVPFAFLSPFSSRMLSEGLRG